MSDKAVVIVDSGESRQSMQESGSQRDGGDGVAQDASSSDARVRALRMLSLELRR